MCPSALQRQILILDNGLPLPAAQVEPWYTNTARRSVLWPRCFLLERQERSPAPRHLRQFLDCRRCIRHVFVWKSTRGRRTRVSVGTETAGCWARCPPLSATTDKPPFGSVSTFVVNLRTLTEFCALEMVGGKSLTESFQFAISSRAVVNTPGGDGFGRGGGQEWRRGSCRFIKGQRLDGPLDYKPG